MDENHVRVSRAAIDVNRECGSKNVIGVGSGDLSVVMSFLAVVVQHLTKIIRHQRKVTRLLTKIFHPPARVRRLLGNKSPHPCAVAAGAGRKWTLNP
jgi:hypothetical protein